MTPPRRSWIRDGLLICLGVKILLFLLGIATIEVRENRPLRSLSAAAAVWNRWDSLHYMEIARNGYSIPDGSNTIAAVTIARPPLEPWLLRAFGWITGSVDSGAVLASTLLSLLPGLLIYALARCDADEKAAMQALLILTLFPASFFLHIAYSEALFLSTTMGAFLAARKGWWKTVALLGVLAGLTRINAFVMAPALCVEAWTSSTGKTRILRLLACLTVFIGVAFFLLLNLTVAGDPLAFLKVYRQLYRDFAWPWVGFGAIWRLSFAGGSSSLMNGVIQVVVTFGMVAACIAAVRWQRASYAVWTVGNTLLIITQAFWTGQPRFALAYFPAFLLLATRTSQPVFGALWFAGSTLLLSFFASLFAQGWWVA